MKNKVYSIKEVATILDIEAYVLRYYEKELELEIHRNTQGHRIYDEDDIEVLRQIKDLREQGLELKAIKNIVHTLDEGGIESLMNLGGMGGKVVQLHGDKPKELDITDQTNEKVQHFQLMMKDMFKQALVEFNGDTKEQIKEELSEEVNCLVNKKIREIEVMQNMKDEEYYNKIDETMREMQKLRREIAEIEQLKPKSSIWKKLFGTKEIENETQEKSM
ncbi:MAG: helix-turn-helix domain-containing protein [Cellulosilyticaceae bacterium]